MNIYKFSFFVLLSFTVLILILFFTPVPEASTGMLHPEIPKMLHSGTPLSATPATKWLSYGFGFFVFLFFACCLLIGSSKNGVLGKAAKWVIGGMVVYTLIYTGMVVSWWEYTDSGIASYFLGWLSPTAWMLFPIWLFPLFFAALLVIKFDDWFLKEEDLKKFREILSEE